MIRLHNRRKVEGTADKEDVEDESAGMVDPVQLKQYLHAKQRQSPCDLLPPQPEQT